jgi:Sulfatase
MCFPKSLACSITELGVLLFRAGALFRGEKDSGDYHARQYTSLIKITLNRSGVLRVFATLSLLATTAIAQSVREPGITGGEKPNIVFILMDNLGYGEPGCYGGGILRGAPTPRIDKLATEGTRLLNFNVEAQCTPSRSAIMTGRFAIRSGTQSIPIGGGLDGLTQWELTIAKLLSNAGYATAHFGKWHLGSEQGRLPNDQVFDEWFGIPRTTDEAFWPSDPQAKAAGVPFMHMMEGRKSEKSRELAISTWINAVSSIPRSRGGRSIS